jgi:hypothetical protein
VERALGLSHDTIQSILDGAPPPTTESKPEEEPDPQFGLMEAAWSDLSDEDKRIVTEMAQRLRRRG